MDLSLASSSFKHTQMIPARFTCDGEDRSPDLSWSGAPPKTTTFAILCDDPDAPGGDWVHWVLFDLPASSSGIPEGVPPTEQLEAGATQGKNSWGRLGYRGPCPPSGTHRYFFTLFALDRRLGLRAGATKADLLKAAEGHILAKAQLMGRYKRK